MKTIPAIVIITARMPIDTISSVNVNAAAQRRRRRGWVEPLIELKMSSFAIMSVLSLTVALLVATFFPTKTYQPITQL